MYGPAGYRTVTETKLRFKSGDFMIAEPGHDACVVGDEACVMIDWQGFADYAKR